jgi:hypothetical protein
MVNTDLLAHYILVSHQMYPALYIEVHMLQPLLAHIKICHNWQYTTESMIQDDIS